MLAIAMCSFARLNAQTKKMDIQINANSVVHQMKGGIGASWHALIHDIPMEREKYDYPVRFNNPRGSAFGGNPPLAVTAAWQQVFDHASWLGLNFIRVELDQRMYQPQKNSFDWHNDEMQALYRILDWCETNKADVFLQQMWAHVEWNAFPGVHPLLSSPKSPDDFSAGIATLLKHLTITRKYTCIKYFCMVNEPPGGTWGYWWSAGSHDGPTIEQVWKILHQTFKDEKLNILLSGPDWTSLPPLQPEKMTFEPYLDALDVHSYFGIYGQKNNEQTVADWVDYAREMKKPFFITEIGNMNLGWGSSNEGPKSFESALSNALDVAFSMNVGVDGFNRWSFTNKGNLDGQWQLINTFDIESGQYVKTIKPEPMAYYGFAMLSRFMGKYPAVLKTQVESPIEGVVITAYRNRDNNLSVLIVNNTAEPVNCNISFSNKSPKTDFYLYQVTEEKINSTNFSLDPTKQADRKNNISKVVAVPFSISVLSTDYLPDSHHGRIE